MPSAVYSGLTALNSKKVKFSDTRYQNVGPEADPGVQAVCLQVTFIVIPDGRLPLLSARPEVTFPAEE